MLGRQPFISVAELESLFDDVRFLAPNLAEFSLDNYSSHDIIHDNNYSSHDILPQAEPRPLPDIRRLGGTQKIAVEIEGPLHDFLRTLPAGKKLVLGLSDFTPGSSPYRAQGEALKLKRFLVKQGHSVRVIPNNASVLSSATSFHNHLHSDTKLELFKFRKKYYRVIGVQNIDAYALRDQARPARDAKVGMLPPKLAQILINLCGKRPLGARLLDPFCGTGVVLQEAALMGYTPYGTDKNLRMVEYSERNLDWLRQTIAKELTQEEFMSSVAQGDATNYQWQGPIELVACETYLGQPMSKPPVEIKLKEQKQECQSIILGFLRNLANQIETGTSVTLAVPAWLRPDGHYERLNLLDEIEELGYNVRSFKNLGQSDLLYHRDDQVVAREIIVLRKK